MMIIHTPRIERKDNYSYFLYPSWAMELVAKVVDFSMLGALVNEFEMRGSLIIGDSYN